MFSGGTERYQWHDRIYGGHLLPRFGNFLADLEVYKMRKLEKIAVFKIICCKTLWKVNLTLISKKPKSDEILSFLFTGPTA